MIETEFDTIFIGGGLAASLTAIALKRKCPSTRILIVEANAVFPKKVGETINCGASLFLNRFGIEGILQRQLKKAGLRFLFSDANNREWGRCSEYASPSIDSIANGRHLCRSEFDQDMLVEAQRLGVCLWRPVRVVDAEYRPFFSRITTDDGRRVCGRWLVDASGRRCMMSHKMAWFRPHEHHCTAAMWGHFKNWKMPEGSGPQWRERAIAPEKHAISHLMRRGRWWWMIPLNDGTTSVGVVYDKTMSENNRAIEQSARDRFKEWLARDPLLNQLNADATMDSFRVLPHLSYSSQHYAIPGLALIGDAGAFVDPLFSSGIELLCQQVLHLERLLFLDDAHVPAACNAYTQCFKAAYETRFELFKGRYQSMGDMEIFSVQTQLDVSGYLGLSILPSAMLPRLLRFPPRFSVVTRALYRCFQWRLSVLCQRRRDNGLVEQENLGRRQWSSVWVPPHVGRLFKGIHLLSLFCVRYTLLEWRSWRRS